MDERRERGIKLTARFGHQDFVLQKWRFEFAQGFTFLASLASAAVSSKEVES